MEHALVQRLYLLGVELVLPLIRHIMRILNDICHEQLGIEDAVLFWYHPSRNSENGTEHGEVEQDGPMWSDFEMHHHIRIQDSGEQKYSGERPGDECHKARTIHSLAYRKLCR